MRNRSWPSRWGGMSRARRALPKGQGSATINLGASTFIPKPFTPFQWEPMIDGDETRRRQRLITAELGGRTGAIQFKPHDARPAAIEQGGIEPGQHAGRGVAALPGVDHLGVDAPRLQQSLQTDRIGLPGGYTEAFGVAGTQRHDAHWRRLRGGSPGQRKGEQGCAGAAEPGFQHGTPPLGRSGSGSKGIELFTLRGVLSQCNGVPTPWSNAPIAANSEIPNTQTRRTMTGRNCP